MVTEQLGPQGKDGWMHGSTGGVGGDTPRTKHPVQWVGPLDRWCTATGCTTHSRETPTRATSFAARIFTKSEDACRATGEYRFAILRDGAVDEKTSLTISGMMRDALQPGKSVLVRPPPQPAEGGCALGGDIVANQRTHQRHQPACDGDAARDPPRDRAVGDTGSGRGGVCLRRAWNGERVSREEPSHGIQAPASRSAAGWRHWVRKADGRRCSADGRGAPGRQGTRTGTD